MNGTGLERPARIHALRKVATMTTDRNPEAGLPESAAEDRPGGLATSAIVRTQRALQILRTLQAGQVWSTAELAAQFDCSTRTIFRDIQLLRECGIPIDSPRGERGFKLSHDFFWQPERPTLEEMIALVLGARMAKEAMPKDMAKSLGTAVAKLVGSERPAVRQRLTELNLRIDAPHVASQGGLPDVEYLPLLLGHIVAQTHVRLVLASDATGDAASDAPDVREVIPVRLHFAGQWLLVITAWEGGSEQTLPLSQIARVESPPRVAGEQESEPEQRDASDLEPPPAAELPPGAAATPEPATAAADPPPQDAAQASENQTMSMTDSE